MCEGSTDPMILPHHEQQPLCSTRLPYRQGRKLTAVKVYSVNNESRHLLVFGVPSLNLRQETKALFSKFGKLQFNATNYPSEQFTETFHAVFEDIQSARIAKKMLDTKNYYGGILHICYAPELESVSDTRQKLLQRHKSVVNRLKNLQKSIENKIPDILVTKQEQVNQTEVGATKLFMGDTNKIDFGKRKATDYKSVKHCKLKKSRNFDRKTCVAVTNNDLGASLEKGAYSMSEIKEVQTKTVGNILPNTDCEVVDFTSTETEVMTNINETLNYNNFGNEVIKKVPYKPVNKIKFNLNKNM